MNTELIETLLQNYTALVERIDAHTNRIQDTYKDQMACRRGCDSCCRFLTLFPVEALALSRAFENLPGEDRARIETEIKRIASRETDRPCPLLIDHACMLYPARPLICRTHGYPLYMEKEGEPLVDFCPENFKEAASFSGDDLLSLEQLNTTLTAVNAHFLSLLEGDLPQRLPVDRALYLCRNLGLSPGTEPDPETE